VRVIDSGTASAAIAMLGLAAQRRLERGTTDEEIEALAARYTSRAVLLFTVETLEYLRRGGRIGRARALAGDMLSIRPILTIVDAEVVPLKRVRGNHKAFLEFASEFESRSRDVPELKVGIAHADAPAKAEALQELVRRTRPQADVELSTSLGPVLGAHAGPGTVGFFWFEDS
jgi:DegV family protein with EDD domain